MLIVGRKTNVFDSKAHVLLTEPYYLPRDKKEHAVLLDSEVNHQEIQRMCVEEPRVNAE